MTTDAKITQCPKCDTTFRITPAQLKVAKGAVRCGACLHVFRASDHFQEPAKPEPQKTDDRTADMFGTEPEAKQSPAPEPVKDDIDENALIQDDEDDFLIDDDNGLIHDEMDDDSEDKSLIGELNEEFLSLDSDDLSDPFFGEDQKNLDSHKAQEENDEAWAEGLLDDDFDDEPLVAAKPAAVKKPQVTAQSESASQNESTAQAPQENKAPNFSYIQQDPLELALPEKRSKLPFIIWGLLSLILLSGLVAQAAYFNFDQWARYEQYRPYYQLACEQLGCTLPSSYDLSRIRTTASPQVSSHARYKNALTVDILFMNDAQYEQAFPRLELSFSDNNDNVVAHRLFSPDEYLAGEAAGLSMMPVQTPIHIAIEIQDPGKNASNYQVRFLAP